MLDTSEILNLIRLTELELRKLQRETASDDQEKANEAGEVIVQFDTLAKKLCDMYLDANPDYEIYPDYAEYVKAVSE